VVQTETGYQLADGVVRFGRWRQVIEEADAASFRVLTVRYARDANSVF
jgi:hypothetical protein